MGDSDSWKLTSREIQERMAKVRSAKAVDPDLLRTLEEDRFGLDVILEHARAGRIAEAKEFLGALQESLGRVRLAL